MTVTVHIPTLFRALTQDQKLVEAVGSNVIEIIEDMERRHPGLRDRLMAHGQAHRFINIYVNDDDIRFGDLLATRVASGDTITILPAVAGGSEWGR